MTKNENTIILFKEQKIRRTWHNEEWWFSVVDVVGVLTDSSNARRYWSDLKSQLIEKEDFSELYEKQSVPSPKAEPFKRWLAKVGYERIQEIENPELEQWNNINIRHCERSEAIQSGIFSGLLRKLRFLAMTAVFGLLAHNANAEDKIRDYSMSPKESFEQPSTQHSGQRGDEWSDVQMDKMIYGGSTGSATATSTGMGKTTTNIPLPPPPRRAGDPDAVNFSEDRGFMNKFCAESSKIRACKETQRTEVCNRFKSAAVEVQQLLDRVASCNAKAQSGVEGDCDGLDSGRLDLLKQYWQDEDMSYTILFLPDMVLNATASCAIK